MAALEDFLALTQFDSQLRSLHEKARGGTLGGDERAKYERARGDLARMLVFAQQLNRRPGETFRQALRVPVAVRAEIELEDGARESGDTLDISIGGFAVFLRRAVPVESVLPFHLSLPAQNGGSLRGKARVVASAPKGDAFRASFAIQGLDATETERLEILTFDWVIGQMDLLKPKKQ